MTNPRSGKNKTRTLRGRPFEADGSVTRNRIVSGARLCFSRHGYAHATNRMIAAEAGITASALYNYFPTKADIYQAVVAESEQHVAEAYQDIIRRHDSPLQALCAILDFNIDMHGQYPELSLFFGHIRSEISRHPELAGVGDNSNSPTTRIFRRLIHDARHNGEISSAIGEKNIEQMLFACMLGMSAYGLQVDVKQQKKNLLAFRMLIDGSLISKPQP